MHAAVIVNPARVRGLPRLRLACAEAFAASGWSAPEVMLTTPDDPGAGICAEALRAGADLVLAVGGDGTVRECAQSLAGSAVPLGIVPNGAANLVARALRIPGDLNGALTTALRGERRSIDLAVADGTACVAMTGMGLDAAVVKAATGRLKRHAGWLGYAAAALPRLARRPVVFTVALDGQSPFTVAAQTVAVGNLGLLPGGFSLLPDARMDDGKLDVAILAPAGLPGWVSIGVRVVGASRHDDSQLRRYQARQVEVSADTELPRQVDGELLGASRTLSVVARPGALRVMVPRS